MQRRFKPDNKGGVQVVRELPKSAPPRSPIRKWLRRRYQKLMPIRSCGR